MSAAADTVLLLIHGAGDPGHMTSVVETAGYRPELASFSDGPLPRHRLPEYEAVIVLGGVTNVDQEDSHPWLRDEKPAIREGLEAGVPLLGICLGGQLLAEAAGGRVKPARQPRQGFQDVTLSPAAAGDPVFASVPPKIRPIVWHEYEFELPAGATLLAESETARQAFRLNDRPVWGMQFHPEITPSYFERRLGEMVAAGQINEAERRAYLAECERLAPAQEALAATIGSSFLRVAAAISANRGNGSSGPKGE